MATAQQKTFTGAGVRAALLPKIIAATRDAETIGGMERLAGIPQDPESRLRFWLAADKRAAARHGFAFQGGHVIDEAMAECRRLIEQRIDWVVLS